MGSSNDHTSNLAFVSKDRGKAVDYPVVSALDFDLPGVSGPYSSRRSKKSCCTVDLPVNSEGWSSLVLGLGQSPSSCTSICSQKGVVEGHSIDLGLSINYNPRGNRPSNPIKSFAGTSNEVVKVRRPVLDLQLSLSTGPAESDVTTVTTQEFLPHQNYSELSVLGAPVQLVDEGSTSSRWKVGPLVPPLKSPLEIPIPYHQAHGTSNLNAVVPDNIAAEVDTQSLDTTPALVNKRKQRKISVKTCQFEGCIRGARGASGFCIAHGGGRRCQKVGCQKGAEGKTVFCKAHGGGRRCQHLGCTKSAEGRTDYCIGHGGGRRCSHEGCSRAARGKSGLCIRHGGGKRCMMENCTKSAEGISGLCIAHGGGRRCEYPECTKGAQGSTMFCKAHGGGKRCMFLGCTKGAEGSTSFCKGHGGGKRCTSEGCTKSVHGGTLFCVGHGGGKRCAMAGCTKSARGRTSYCVRHGGGKRCKSDGCPKSAQGSTDFCKAHGGGKRCYWGHGDGEGAIPCDKFARGKSGLCAAHSALLQEKNIELVCSKDPTSSTQMFSTGTIVSYTCTSNEYGTTSMGSVGYADQSMSRPMIMPQTRMDDMSLPEGRVHGGSLMAMLRGGATFGTEEQERSIRRWV